MARPTQADGLGQVNPAGQGREGIAMADTDPDALERKIERTRAELARTVDAIADRVSPKRIAQRGVAKVKADAEHLVTSVGDLVGGTTQGAGVTRPPGTISGEEDWEDERTPSIAPILIGVGAVIVVGAAVLLLRRRRRK
jgi:LPXTG-motif cell wall-anchored protein